MTVDQLHHLADIETLELRNKVLRDKYLYSAELNANPLIQDLRNDFQEYKYQRLNPRIKTLLDLN